MAVHVAVDLGASGGRVVAATVAADGSIPLHEVHRFTNGPVRRDGHLRWDLSRLVDEVRAGLAMVPDATSIGIDTWAVDYGLIDEQGRLLGEPIAYRDDRTDAVQDEVHALVDPAELFGINGLQHLPFTTLYQLVAETHEAHWSEVARAVLLPDLIAHALTGELRTEVTNASTTGLLDVRTGAWSTDLFQRLGLPPDLFPPLDEPGDLRGHTPDGTPVRTVGSHDTASAVVAVPATTDRFAYISSGTWSLVGMELSGPVLSEVARDAGFTNELGVDGRTRFLRNVGGLWLLQESLRHWRRDDLGALLAGAAALPPGGPTIDVDDPAFIAPDDMPDRIAAAAGAGPLDEAGTVRCVLDSLALGYARTIAAAEAVTGIDVEVVHVVGGGSRNDLLCRLTADATGRPVVAGPAEASALGNVIVQARATGDLPASLDEIRRTLAVASPPRRYDPS
ncbi:MAG: rhamnulokinase [Actinobacteria bacterium]|nr:rhamnulokinase [Actinomycetota bacterium]